MSIITHDRTLAGDRGQAGLGLAELRTLFRTWQARIRERAFLATLGERELHDMGVGRAEIQYEISKPFWRA